jgi:hypothetical protein
MPSSHCCSCHHCCHRIMIVSHPATLTEEKNICFIYGTRMEKVVQIPDFQQVQIWNDCSQKQKKNYGSHPFGETMLHLLFCSSVGFIHVGNRKTCLGTLPKSSTVLILILDFCQAELRISSFLWCTFNMFPALSANAISKLLVP